MPAINADTVPFWRDIAVRASRQRPYAGRRVLVCAGRKARGECGTVILHMRDQYDTVMFRYGSDAGHHMTEMYGRRGYVAKVRLDSGVVCWIKARYLMCCDAAAGTFDYWTEALCEGYLAGGV